MGGATEWGCEGRGSTTANIFRHELRCRLGGGSRTSTRERYTSVAIRRPVEVSPATCVRVMQRDAPSETLNAKQKE